MGNQILHGGRIAVLAIGLATAGTAVAQSQEPDRRFYVAPMASFGLFDEGSVGDTTLELDDGFGGTLAVGKPFGKFLNLELYGFLFPGVGGEARGAMSGSGEADIDGYGINALYFPDRDALPIFGIIGYAAGSTDADFLSGSDPSIGDTDHVDFGLGYLFALNDYGLAVRGEYRFRNSEIDAGGVQDLDTENHIFSVGLQIPLGAGPEEPEPEPAPPPPPEPEPRDSDGDGVTDENDDCPGTPPGTEVDDRGCPKQAAVTKDKPLVLPGTNFAFDSAELRGQAEAKLDEVVITMEENPNLDLRIEGHTDSKGAQSYNMRLSRERAQAVKQYLVDNGVSADRLTAKGFGESDPVAPNTDPDGSDNPEGRAKNRRVEIHVAE